ncbi:MAG: hypothetical protein E6Q06_02215 [Candidatus Moraniibacteriota bacterium]|nr:MAG: hypothetical protein E6Q06_02215 [Candidatus Moranbacteria bacterium]
MGTFTINCLIKEITMAAEFLQGMLKGVNVLEILNLFQMSSVRGLLNKVGLGKGAGSSGSDENTKEAKEDGRGLIDELNALIAMAEAHFGARLANMPAEDNTVTRGRFRKLMALFKVLHEQGKSGGAEKLMHIIGHESHLQGTASIPKATKDQKSDSGPTRIDIQNVRQRTNPAGKLIIRFLTDLQTAEAVELLTVSSITDTGKDKAAAAAKAAADKAGEWQQRWKEYYGKHDTALHELAVLLATDRETLRRITESARAEELRAAVEAAPEGEKRARHEAYQLYLQEMVKHFRNPAIIRAQAAESGAKPPRFTLKRIVIGLAILCIVLVASIGMVPTN